MSPAPRRGLARIVPQRVTAGAAWLGGAIRRRSARPRAAVMALRDATMEAQRSKLPQMAAALSYRTVFGLIPVLVVTLVAMKLFFTTESEIAEVLNRALRYSGISSIATGPMQDPTPMGPFPEDAPYQEPQSPDENRAGAGSAGSTRPEVLPPDGPPATPEQQAVADQSAARLDQWIRDLVARVSTINFKAIGAIGVIALLYAAISMLVEVERAFNQIYRVPVGRSWLRRFVNYWALLCWGGVGLLCSFLVTEWFSRELVDLASPYAGQRASALITTAMGYLSTVTISTAMLLLMYLVVPNTRVKISAALVGALVAGVLWEAGKWGFTQYLKFSTGYAKLYGSIALIPLFLLWVYVTWCIVLFGLNIAYYLQHGRRRTEPEPTDCPEPTVVDPGATLAVMAALARRFDEGQPAEASALARDLNLPAAIVKEMLQRLAAAGLVNRVVRAGENGSDVPEYALSRPAERISAEEVVKVGEDLAGTSVRGPVGEAMRAARREAVRDRTLAAFLDNGHLQAPSADPAGTAGHPLPG